MLRDSSDAEIKDCLEFLDKNESSSLDFNEFKRFHEFSYQKRVLGNQDEDHLQIPKAANVSARRKSLHDELDVLKKRLSSANIAEECGDVETEERKAHLRKMAMGQRRGSLKEIGDLANLLKEGSAAADAVKRGKSKEEREARRNKILRATFDKYDTDGTGKTSISPVPLRHVCLLFCCSVYLVRVSGYCSMYVSVFLTYLIMKQILLTRSNSPRYSKSINGRTRTVKSIICWRILGGLRNKRLPSMISSSGMNIHTLSVC